jgi:hypothetical protein
MAGLRQIFKMLPSYLMHETGEKLKGAYTPKNYISPFDISIIPETPHGVIFLPNIYAQ